MARMNMVSFVLYTIAGTSLWNFVLAIAGRLLGASWPVVAEWIGVYQNVVLVLGVVVVVAFVGYRLWLQQKKKSQANQAG